MRKPVNRMVSGFLDGGSGGIRTHEPIARLPDFERPKGKKRRGFSRSFKVFEYAEKSLYHAGLTAIKAEAARYTSNIRKEALLLRIRVETIEN